MIDSVHPICISRGSEYHRMGWIKWKGI